MNAEDHTPELSARERILLTAHDLFYSDGVRATGIDKVIAEAPRHQSHLLPPFSQQKRLNPRLFRLSPRTLDELV